MKHVFKQETLEAFANGSGGLVGNPCVDDCPACGVRHLAEFSGMNAGIREAVLNERERCAKVADNYTEYWPKSGVTWGDDVDEVAAKCIAAAIRSGAVMARVPRYPIPGGPLGMTKERYDGIMAVIVKAVLDECERCAGVVAQEGHDFGCPSRGQDHDHYCNCARGRIIAKIRRGQNK